MYLDQNSTCTMSFMLQSCRSSASLYRQRCVSASIQFSSFGQPAMYEFRTDFLAKLLALKLFWIVIVMNIYLLCISSPGSGLRPAAFKIHFTEDSFYMKIVCWFRATFRGKTMIEGGRRTGEGGWPKLMSTVDISRHPNALKHIERVNTRTDLRDN